jgi:sigma-B regulation protein RsbU (phosphoserine phosphatase)
MPDYLASFMDRQKLPAEENDDINRRLIELSALFEISQTLNSSLNLQSILNNVLLVPMGRMMLGKGIILLKKDENIFTIETLKGLSHTLINKEINLTGLPNHAFLIGSMPESTEWLSFFSDFKLEVMIPFMARTDVLGLMGFGRKLNGEPFSEAEIEFLTSLGNIATTSIENALVFEKIKQVNRQLDHKIQELNTLFDIGKELNLTFERTKILKLLSYALMGQVMVNNYVVALKDDDFFEAALVKGSSFPLREGERCGELCERCTFIHTPYLRDDAGEFDDYLGDLDVRVIIPMQIQNETKGYIFLGEKITKKEFSRSDLEFLQTLGNVAIISLENSRLFQEMLEKQRLEEEMAMARNIQNRLLPKTMPRIEPFEIDGLNVPSLHVGGDYFDIIRIDKNHVGITIADVSGKGMPAALLMSNLQASLQTLVHDNFPPDKLVSRINDVIYKNTDTEKYITFFFGKIDLQTLEMKYVNAGHNPPFLVHADGSSEELSEGGIILGMMPDVHFKIGLCRFKPGDILMLYTDGVTETMTIDEEEYEEHRLLGFLQSRKPDESPARINQALIADLKSFAGKAPQIDDITLLTLRIKNGSA